MSTDSEPRDIVLVGFMGAGKSTVARELSRLGGYRMVDLDQLIVEREGRSIPEIFSREGEAYFRTLESQTLASLQGGGGRVLATGGGIVERKDNWPLMRRLGPVFYLRAAAETLRLRLAGATGRPLADGASGWEEVAARLMRRMPLYQQADLVVDTDRRSPEEVAAEILRLLEEEGE